jgi:hypothetical protein
MSLLQARGHRRERPGGNHQALVKDTHPAGFPVDRTRQSAIKSPTMQRRLVRKDLQMQAFSKRLMGFEPTTFCMASSTFGRYRPTTYLQTGAFRGLDRRLCFVELGGNTGGLDKQRTMSHGRPTVLRSARSLGLCRACPGVRGPARSCYSGRRSQERLRRSDKALVHPLRHIGVRASAAPDDRIKA